MSTELQYRILLDRLITELNLGNELMTDSDEFACYVMQWTDAIERMFKGLEPIPDNWITHYLFFHPNENPGL